MTAVLASGLILVLLAAVVAGAAASFLFWGPSLAGRWLLDTPHGRRLLAIELAALGAASGLLAAARPVLSLGPVEPALAFLAMAITCNHALVLDLVEHGPGRISDGLRRSTVTGLGAIGLTSWSFLAAAVAGSFAHAPSAQAVLQPYFLVLAAVWAAAWAVQVSRQTARR